LATDGYALRAGSAVPLSAKADVEIVDVAEGLKNAVLDKAQKGEFGELTALYVRKSSAEINLEGAK
jgi:hypothetical protein